MKFTLDARPDIHLIRGYGPGEVRINDQVLHANCIVTADALIMDWKARNSDSLTLEELQPILDLKPELVLLGTGSKQRFPPSTVRSLFTSRRIGLETMDLGAACRTYNILVQEERRVAAALFLA
jgi:uncharacterized protein